MYIKIIFIFTTINFISITVNFILLFVKKKISIHVNSFEIEIISDQFFSLTRES